MKAVEPRKALSTLVDLYSGNRCPHENECACRTSNWCRKAGEVRSHDYPMLHLAGCSMSSDHCCCKVLDEVESLADDYLESATIAERPVPLNIIELCDPKRPIELRPFPLKAYFGCAWFLGNEWVVHLNQNQSTEMNRFTAFHEAFHIVCSNSRISFSKAGDCYKPLSERLADYFSASILMPRRFVHELWPQVQDVTKMAEVFVIPRPVMADWLTRLGLIEYGHESGPSVSASSELK